MPLQLLSLLQAMLLVLRPLLLLRLLLLTGFAFDPSLYIGSSIKAINLAHIMLERKVDPFQKIKGITYPQKYKGSLTLIQIREILISQGPASLIVPT